jgi:hypothetical protein
MIPVPSGVKVWTATGVTDMRRGVNGLSLQVQGAGLRGAYVSAAPRPASPCASASRCVQPSASRAHLRSGLSFLESEASIFDDAAFQ